MLPLAERDIRRSFVNCSKGEAERANLPVDLAGLPWADLDFLGWRDRGAPQLAYLVAERGGQLTGVTLRAPTAGKRSFTARSMCSLCLTTRTASGVALMTADEKIARMLANLDAFLEKVLALWASPAFPTAMIWIIDTLPA